MQITIYSTPTCPYCIQAKQYFKSKNIPFEDIDVSDDETKAQEMIEISGQMGVPVIKIDNKVLIGFDQEEVEKALKYFRNSCFSHLTPDASHRIFFRE